MSRLLFASLVVSLASATSLARPWNGIIPGVSSPLDVVGKFGEPTKRVMVKGQEIYVYSGASAITGTRQAQFKANPSTHVIERIDVYPAPIIEVASVEQAYGKACDPMKPVEPCYFRKESPSKTVYFLYLKLGLAVFFKEDGKTVQSFVFLPESLKAHGD